MNSSRTDEQSKKKWSNKELQNWENKTLFAEKH